MNHESSGAGRGEQVKALDSALLRWRLAVPEGVWRAVEVTERTGSTNDDALAAAEPYRIVIAAEQTAGRGRRARAWSSPPGTSIAMSMTLPAPGREGLDVGWVPLAVGVGVRDALAEVMPPMGGDGDVRFVLKWPNDVLVSGARHTSVRDGRTRAAKIGGILCQASLHDPPLVVAGVGINVTVPVPALPAPDGIALPATSLHLLDAAPPPTREAVACAVADHVARRHAQWLAGGSAFEALRRDYESHCVTVDREVDVHLPTGDVRRARATGVAPGGELRVVGQDGIPQDIRAGDVVHIRLGTGED